MQQQLAQLTAQLESLKQQQLPSQPPQPIAATAQDAAKGESTIVLRASIQLLIV
jgi:hypothetical protein